MKFNRECIAYIDNKKITIYSYNTINKIIDNTLSVKEDILIFEASKETSTYIYNKIMNKNEVNLRIDSGYLPNYYLVDVNLILEYKSSCEDNKMRDKYKIKECKNNINITNEELLINATRTFKSNFVILKDNKYCIVHRVNNKEYYYKDEINISENVYDRIKYYLRNLKSLSNDNKIREKLCLIIKKEFEDDLKENNNSLWKKIGHTL